MESAVAVVRRIVCSLLILLGVLAAPPAATAQEKIRLGLLPFSESLGAVIAERQGFFKAEGLDVEVTKFESGALAVPVLQSGRIDIAFSNTVSTLQAIEQGLDAILLAPGAVVRSSPPDTTTALIVRKGAISTLKDLEGKRVAVNVINSSAWLHAVAALEKHGVDRSKVRFTEVPFPQMNDPLLNGQLDAVPLGADGDRQSGNRELDLCRDRSQLGHHAVHRAGALGREEPRDGGEIRTRGDQGGAVRQRERGRHARHQPAVYRPEPRAEGHGAAAAAGDGGECRRNDAHDGADAEVRAA
jgi:ABC-type amino acid transport substrate-binding protein